MLAALLLVGLIAAPLSSAALSVPGARPGHVVGPVPAVRRLALAVLGTLLVGAAGYAVPWLLAVPAGQARVAPLVFVIVSLAWLPAKPTGPATTASPSAPTSPSTSESPSASPS